MDHANACCLCQTGCHPLPHPHHPAHQLQSPSPYLATPSPHPLHIAPMGLHGHQGSTGPTVAAGVPQDNIGLGLGQLGHIAIASLAAGAGAGSVAGAKKRQRDSSDELLLVHCVLCHYHALIHYNVQWMLSNMLISSYTFLGILYWIIIFNLKNQILSALTNYS